MHTKYFLYSAKSDRNHELGDVDPPSTNCQNVEDGAGALSTKSSNEQQNTKKAVVVLGACHYHSSATCGRESRSTWARRASRI